MHPYLLETTELNASTLAHVGEKDSIDSFQDLIGIVSARCGPEVASLFAEPVRGFNRVSKAPNITWYCAYEGTPFPVTHLDASERQHVADLLRTRLEAFKSLFSDATAGPVLASWLYLLSSSDILSVAGQPVLKNWGMVPTAAATSQVEREAHFRQTLEGVVPNTPAPPFSNDEAQSFANRLAGNAAPEESAAAQPETRSSSSPPRGIKVETPRSVSPVKADPGHARPWLPPLIATTIAAAILAAVNLFDMLRYPEANLTKTAGERLELQRQTNQALSERLQQLKLAANNVCQAVPGARNPPGAGDFQPLLPVTPERTSVPTPAKPGQAQPTPSTIADLLDKATVLVVNGDSIGSGFFISDRDIVTNHHVVGDSAKVTIGNRALGGFFPAKVVAVGNGRSRGTQDLAVLEIEPNPGSQALKIGVAPERLRPVMAAGFPGAILSTIKLSPNDQLPEANLSAGIVTSHQIQEPDRIGTIIHTAQIGHGNSGGPLVDEGACAVGVNSWLSLDADRVQSYQTYNESLDARELRQFLDSRNISYSSADADCSPTPLPAPPAAKPDSPAPRPTAAPPKM